MLTVHRPRSLAAGLGLGAAAILAGSGGAWTLLAIAVAAHGLSPNPEPEPEVHPALAEARRHREAGTHASPAHLHRLARADRDLYLHAMREAGLIVKHDSREPENPCETCGWSPKR